MIEELTIRIANKISHRIGVSKEQVIFLALVNYMLDYKISDLDEDLDALLDALQHLIPGENLVHETKLLEKTNRTITYLATHSLQYCETLLPRLKEILQASEQQCS